jgi:hypothetical protein
MTSTASCWRNATWSISTQCSATFPSTSAWALLGGERKRADDRCEVTAGAERERFLSGDYAPEEEANLD